VDDRHTCRKCGAANPEDYAKWRPRLCRDCANAYRREYYKAKQGSDVSYAQLLKREYGLTLDEYNAMVQQQGNRCAICRRPETMKMRGGQIRRLSVDHDHATGLVRGLLCQRCNLVVWALEDNHTTLDAVRAYLEEWRAAHRG